MKINKIKADSFISKNTGADISYHKITWTNQNTPKIIPAGGNIAHHTLPARGTVPHAHDYAEIIFILSGSIAHHINGERMLLKSGNIVFVRPSDTHYFQADANSECEMLILAFTLEMFLKLSQYLENDYFLQHFTEPVLPPVFRMEGTRFTDLTNRLLSINSDLNTPLNRKIKIKIFLAELFTHFFIDEINRLSEIKIPVWIEQLCDLMRKQENYIAGLSKMQKLAGCTKEHLCKSFKRYINKTPTEFINELRMAHAARMLADTNEEIYAIAYDLNIHSLSRFYHLFKRYYAMSPAKYRKKTQTGKSIL